MNQSNAITTEQPPRKNYSYFISKRILQFSIVLKKLACPRRTRHGLSALLLLFLPAFGAQDDFSLQILDASSSTSGTVRLIVSVLDSQGTPIHGLNKSNFQPRVEETVIGDFSVDPVSSARNPLSVVLALDISGSMHGAPIAEAKKAAGAFLEQLADKDQVALIAFGSSVQLLSEFTSNKATAKEKLDTLSANEMKTWLYAATYDSLERGSNAPTSRTAVVLLTDGKDEGSPKTEDEVLKRIGGARVPIFALGFGPNAQTDYLRKIANASRGYFFFAPAAEELGHVYSQVTEQLKNQYQIEFRFDKPAGDYIATLALRFGGKEKSARVPFLHVLVGTSVPWWKRWLDNWVLLASLGVLIVLFVVGLVFLLRYSISRVSQGSQAQIPVELVIEGKHYPLSIPSDGSANQATVVAQNPSGEAGLIVDLPPAPAYLALINGQSGQRYNELVITRFDRNSVFDDRRIYLLLSDRSVSRPDGQRRGHAAVFLEQGSGRYQIKDLGSIGGTRLNGKLLKSAAYLENGDAITVGAVALKYYDMRSGRETSI